MKLIYHLSMLFFLKLIIGHSVFAANYSDMQANWLEQIEDHLTTKQSSYSQQIWLKQKDYLKNMKTIEATITMNDDGSVTFYNPSIVVTLSYIDASFKQRTSKRNLLFSEASDENLLCGFMVHSYSPDFRDSIDEVEAVDLGIKTGRFLPEGFSDSFYAQMEVTGKVSRSRIHGRYLSHLTCRYWKTSGPIIARYKKLEALNGDIADIHEPRFKWMNHKYKISSQSPLDQVCQKYGFSGSVENGLEISRTGIFSGRTVSLDERGFVESVQKSSEEAGIKMIRCAL